MTLSCHKLTGHFKKAVRVATNDPSQPEVKLICEGTILDPLLVKPKHVNFGAVAASSAPITKTVVLTRADGGPLDPKLKAPNVHGLSANLKVIEAGEKYELEVTLTPPFHTDRFRGKLELETGVEKSPTVDISVFAQTKPRVTPSPRRFTVPEKRGPGWKQVVKLDWDDGVPPTVLNATVNDDSMSVTLQAVGGKTHVVLQVSQNYQRSDGARAVTIDTDDLKLPKITVPISMARERTTSRIKRRVSDLPVTALRKDVKRRPSKPDGVGTKKTEPGKTSTK